MSNGWLPLVSIGPDPHDWDVEAMAPTPPRRDVSSEHGVTPSDVKAQICTTAPAARELSG